MMGIMRSPRSSRKPKGFTIVELVIATCVLTLAIATSLTVMGRGFASLDSARCFSYASQIMQSEFEKMRLTHWGNGTAAGNGTTGVTQYTMAETEIPIDASFYTAGTPASRMTMKRTVQDIHDGMLKITLKITWRSHSGQQLSRSYSTYYGKNGLYDFFVI